MYSYIIKNGMVVDGSGKEPFKADVAINNGKIAAVEPYISPELGEKVVDAAGKYVTPGFIDIHRHADSACFKPWFGEPELRQGLTTVINGNCGHSIAPCPVSVRPIMEEYLEPIVGKVPDRVRIDTFAHYMDSLKAENLAINCEMLVGHGMSSAAVRGYGDGQPSDEEILSIRKNLEEGLKAGARGVSIGLGYTPECYYSKETLIKTLEPLKGTGLPLCTHVRGEGDSVLKAISEVIDIAKTLKIQLEVSHLKCIGKRNWGAGMDKALELIENAREEGLDVACDFYPYTAGSTQMTILLPGRFLSHGIEGLIDSLHDEKIREEITHELMTPSDKFENTVELVGWENIRMSTLNTPENKQYQGMKVTDIAKLRGQDPYNCVYDMLIEENGTIAMLDTYACEEDVIKVMKHPLSSIISDAIYPEGILHPRVYGTYPRILEKYVREEKVLTISEAVHKMTGKPAAVHNLNTKGLIKTGMDGDVIVFDLNRIHTGATFETPEVMGEGIDYSFVGGIPRIFEGRYLGKSVPRTQK